MNKKNRETPGRLMGTLWLVSLSMAACTAAAQTALPLTGPVFDIADAAYKAYARGDYRTAATNAREAVRLRPDVVALKTLLRKAEAASQARPRTRSNQAGNTHAAVHPAPQPSPLQPPASVDPTIALAFNAADSAYQAYDSGQFSLAVERASTAVRLAPAKRDYRQLLVNSLIAANRLPEAEAAIQDALSQPVEEAVADSQFRSQWVTQQADLQERMRSSSAQALATSAYSAFAADNFAQAAEDARLALALAPTNRNYHLLRINALYRAGLYTQAAQAVETAMANLPEARQDTALVVQRGFIRQRLGQNELAKQDFEAALGSGSLPAATEIGLLLDLDRKQEARQRFDAARDSLELAGLPDAELAYLAARLGNDVQALAYFNRADANSKLPNTAYEDAAFAAVRSREDGQALAYFKRVIDDAQALKLKMAPQLQFNTRRAVAEVSREWGLIASLSYRGIVSGVGVNPNAGTDSVQGGVEAYWRPWGYQNGQYAEVFARAFQTLYSQVGASGGQTLQAAAGIRYKPLAQQNLVLSFSRVASPTGGRNDWLAQLGYSAGRGTDLRVDVPSWWTHRVSGEAGRYLSLGQTYALGEVQAGKSFRLGDSSNAANGRWVLFPHLSLAADYDSAATEKSSAGFGPGMTARYWFNEDRHSAPRSYVDVSLQYRAKLAGAARSKGLFLTSTLSY